MLKLKSLTIGSLLVGSVLLAGCSPQAAEPTASDTPAAGTVLEGSGADVGADDAPVARVKEFVVEGSNMKFSPAEMKVKKGDKVKITFKNVEGFHDFVLDEFDVKTQQIQGGAEEVVEFVADEAGSFEYYCSVGKHREMGMKGTLIVEE